MVIRSGASLLLLAGVQRAGAAHAAHDLVEDQQHAVAIADRADALEIVGDRRHRARGAPTTVSATNAITVSGPSSRILSSSDCAARRVGFVAFARSLKR